MVLVALLAAVSSTSPGRAQTPDTLESAQWLFTSTKVAYAVDRWRFYGDMQFRLNNNWRALDQWLVAPRTPTYG